ncbi:ester cyclase [Streptomyces sp. NPDC050617]|uniref:ester cyclase n=1 Tax=Streptomyces sp. NPDC050617 TaxID=3154628 RepID=UPI003418FDBC
MTTAQDHIEQVNQIVKALNAGNDFPASLMDDQLEYKDWATGMEADSADEFYEYAKVWFAAFSDLTFGNDSIVATDRACVHHWWMTGTLTDHFAPFPLVDKGQRGSGVILHGASTYEYGDDGKVVKFSEYYDMLSLLRQVGVELP